MASDERLRRSLVAQLRRSGFIRGERVADAFETVPRHLFVPDRPLKDTYSNQALITKTSNGIPVSSSSEPSIMAIMLQQLDLELGQRVLEIGAGTGYNAALLSHLVGGRGHVTTLDIDPEIASDARAHLRSAGCRSVRVVAGDGGFGYSEHAPYDRIIVTASCWQIPQPWIDQLADGGLMVLPFRLNGAHVSLALRKHGQALESSRAAMCGFMPLRGAFGPAPVVIAGPRMRVVSDFEMTAAEREALSAALAKERTVRVAFPRPRDSMNTPLYYLALQGKTLLNIYREGVQGWGPMPFGLVASLDSIITLSWSRAKGGRHSLYGSDAAIEFVRDALARWQAEGKPDLRQLRVGVTPSSASLGPMPRRTGDGYRLRRGAHRYDLRFER